MCENLRVHLVARKHTAAVIAGHQRIRVASVANVFIANLVAWPLAFAYLNNWLEQFASHIAFQAWHFLLPGMASVIITLLTISYITIKAGRTNPARILTYE